MRYYKLTDGDQRRGICSAVGGYRAKAKLVDALSSGAITETDIREDWRDEIMRRAQALNVRVETYT